MALQRDHDHIKSLLFALNLKIKMQLLKIYYENKIIVYY